MMFTCFPVHAFLPPFHTRRGCGADWHPRPPLPLRYPLSEIGVFPKCHTLKKGEDGSEEFWWLPGMVRDSDPLRERRARAYVCAHARIHDTYLCVYVCVWLWAKIGQSTRDGENGRKGEKQRRKVPKKGTQQRIKRRSRRDKGIMRPQGRKRGNRGARIYCIHAAL